MTDLEKAIDTLQKTDSSLVVLKGNEIKSYSESGIKNLVGLLKEDPEALMGATIADKVIGKVAGAIMIRAGVKEVYAKVMSQLALELFETYNIEAKYEINTSYIKRRDNSGMCPMEEKFFGEDDIDVIWDEYIG